MKFRSSRLARFSCNFVLYHCCNFGAYPPRNLSYVPTANILFRFIGLYDNFGYPPTVCTELFHFRLCLWYYVRILFDFGTLFSHVSYSSPGTTLGLLYCIGPSGFYLAFLPLLLLRPLAGEISDRYGTVTFIFCTNSFDHWDEII